MNNIKVSFKKIVMPMNKFHIHTVELREGSSDNCNGIHLKCTLKHLCFLQQLTDFTIYNTLSLRMIVLVVNGV